MHILFLTKGDRSVASSRMRVWQIAERLEQKFGYSTEVVHSFKLPWYSFTKQKLKTLFSLWRSIKRADILWVHKSLFPADVVLIVLFARIVLRKRLIYDLDDAEWIHSPLRSIILAKSAHGVFAGSHEIQSWALGHTTQSFLIPTTVNAFLYEQFYVLHKEAQCPTIAWVGSGKSHFQSGNFAVLKESFLSLAQEGNKFKFLIIGAQSFKPLKEYFQGVPFEVEYVDELEWDRADAVPSILQKYQVDIGVMPLEDTPFNRAKCAFKAIEYMACGIPVVASAVGESLYLIRQGENGYLAQTAEEWTSSLRGLLHSGKKRKQIGDAGFQVVRKTYDQAAVVDHTARILRELS